MKVLIRLAWHIKIDDYIDLLNIDTTAEKICRDKNSMLTLFEIIVYLQSLLHRHISADSHRREILFLNDLVQFFCIVLSLRENDYLVKVKIVEELNKLLDLLVFFKFHEVLLESMKGEFGLRFYEKLKRISHEASADLLGLLGKCS